MKKNLLLLFVMCFFTAVLFAQSTHTLDVFDYGDPSNSSQFNATGYSIDGQVVEFNYCAAQASIAIAVIDTSACGPMNNCNQNFGQANIYTDPNGDCITDVNTTYTCRSRAENYFIYRAYDAASLQSMSSFLNSIQNGNVIIAYSMFPIAYSTLDPAFVNAFQQLGSSLVSTLPDNVPYIFYCIKGNSASVLEVNGVADTSFITLSTTFQCAPTGIEDASLHSLTLFPNPVRDELYLNGNKQNEVLTFHIFDALGRKVYSTTTNESQLNIPVSSFAQGFYFVEVEGEGFHFVRKITLMRD